MGGTICICSRPDDQVSKSLAWLPWYLVSKFLAAIDFAEKELGRPPQVMQIFITLEVRFNSPIQNPYQCCAVLFSLQREDMIYSDDQCTSYTRKKQEGYYTYSELFRKRFGDDYSVNSFGAAIPKLAKTVNYDLLVNVLKSKDEAQLEKHGWMFDGNFRILDGKPIENNKIAFNTFMRSGNSFLRRFLEQITGIATGSSVSMHTATSLQLIGLLGEGMVDDRVWIVKAHHPFRLWQSIPFTSHKVICCVRNPLDVFPSYASMCNTLSHSQKPEFEYEEEFPEWWDWFVKSQAE